MIRIGQKRFNTTGPCFPDEHYMLDALGRLPDIETLIASRLYFVLHAARQAGKTTAVKALAKKLNAEGEIAAMYCTLEGAAGLTDASEAIRYISRTILEAAQISSGLSDVARELKPVADLNPSSAEMGNFVREQIRAICSAAAKPVVMFLDEADCISASAIVPFLRQLRDGYVNRDEVPFPVSIALIGMRDLRDYKAQIRPDRETLGSVSPFNVVKKALTLRNFTESEVGELYAQHTAATGQVFTPETVHRAFVLSDGQPWIVNAIADECVAEIHKNDLDAITLDDVNEAKTNLIRDRATTLYSIFRRIHTDWMQRAFDTVGKFVPDDLQTREAIKLAHLHRAIDQRDGVVRYSCPLVEEAISIWCGTNKDKWKQYALQSA